MNTAAPECMLVEDTYGLAELSLHLHGLCLSRTCIVALGLAHRLFDNHQALLHASTRLHQQCAKDTWHAARVERCTQNKGSCDLPSSLAMHQGQTVGVWLRARPAHAAVLQDRSARWELSLQNSHEGAIGSDQNLLAPFMYLPHGSQLDGVMVFGDMEGAPAQQRSQAQCCHAPHKAVSAAAVSSLVQHAEHKAC